MTSVRSKLPALIAYAMRSAKRSSLPNVCYHLQVALHSCVRDAHQDETPIFIFNHRDISRITICLESLISNSATRNAAEELDSLHKPGACEMASQTETEIITKQEFETLVSGLQCQIQELVGHMGEIGNRLQHVEESVAAC